MIQELINVDDSVIIQKQKLALGLLEMHLGKGIRDRKNNYSFYCPICKHKNRKLAINIVSGKYNCFTCHPPLKGSTPSSLLKKIGADAESIQQMKKYYNVKSTAETEEKAIIQHVLPKEFVALEFPGKTPKQKQACIYLKSRGINQLDVLKYNIGFCESGKYKNKVIIPSYDKNGRLNYFSARAIDDTVKPAYDGASWDKKDIIGFEYFINWKLPIILCEGVFDAMAIKRNAIPLFGKVITEELMKKIIQSDVKTVYLALDKDAVAKAYDYADSLLYMGKEVYCLDLEDKDPSKIGFGDMIKLLQKAIPINTEQTFKRKIQNIMNRV